MKDLEFWYTGATALWGSQGGPTQSLGGFVSKNTVPNGSLFNLWSDIAVLAEEKSNIKAIVVQNISKNPNAKNLNDIRVWFKNKKDENFFWVELGAVFLVDGEMQIINSPYETPQGITFKKYYLLPTSIATGLPISENDLKTWPEDDIEYDPDSDYNNGTLFPDGSPQPIGEEEPNYAVIGDLRPNDAIGFWLKRVIDRKVLSNNFKCDTLYEQYKADLEAEYGIPFDQITDSQKYTPLVNSLMGDTGIEMVFDYDEEATDSEGLYLLATPGSNIMVTP